MSNVRSVKCDGAIQDANIQLFLNILKKICIFATEFRADGNR